MFDAKENDIDRLQTVPLDNDINVGLMEDQKAIDVANGHREEGNRQFHSGAFEEACVSYTRALELLAFLPTSVASSLFTNRCMARLKLNKAALAQQDAEQAARLDPKSFKAQMRLAQCFEAQQELDAACEAYERAHALAVGTDMQTELAKKLFDCRMLRDKIVRSEHLNMSYTSTASPGIRAQMAASQGLQPDEAPWRDWDMLEKLGPEGAKLFPVGQQLIMKAKKAMSVAHMEEAVSFLMQAARGYNVRVTNRCVSPINILSFLLRNRKQCTI